jgi:hypothetical protein
MGFLGPMLDLTAAKVKLALECVGIHPVGI